MARERVFTPPGTRTVAQCQRPVRNVHSRTRCLFKDTPWSRPHVRLSPGKERYARNNVAACAEESGSSMSEFVDASIPQDVLEMFKEAQQRIIDLNQSRLHALEELAEARAKIIDLEERLSQAEKDALGLTMEVAREASEMKELDALPSTEIDSISGSGDDLSDKSFEASAGVISLLYETSWEPAYIHFNCPEQSSWTDSPGMKMKAGELPNHKVRGTTSRCSLQCFKSILQTFSKSD